jgi:multidrug transporter EmrE-like cation transporter
MSSTIVFAILAGVSAATWTICLKLRSTKISAALGAMVITGVAFVVNALALLAMRASGQEIVFSREGFYERGLKVTASFFIGGTSTLLVLLVGFLALQEPFTWGRFLPIALIVAGSLLLQTQGG